MLGTDFAGQKGVWPIRALWAWPAATLALGLAELAQAIARHGFEFVSVVLAAWASFGLGVWLGVLWALLASFAEGRGWLWRFRIRWPGRGNPRFAVGLVAALVLALLGWVAVGPIRSLAESNPIDYPQTSVKLWRSGVVLGLPLLAFVMYPLLRRLEDRIVHARTRKFVARVSLSLLVALVLHHFTSGPFFVYFGAPMALALLALTAGSAATWIPRAHKGATRRTVLALIAPIVLWPGVWFGLMHPGARALLLHDAHVMPHVVWLGVGWLDGDDDRDLPTWIGGGDCDDDDPMIASSRVEIPGNGIDDNCVLGDAAPTEDARKAFDPGVRPPIVLLVTIDTVRVDRLELYGAARETMPALATLGARGLVFERAYAAANHTFYAIPAILSGQSTERMIVPPGTSLPQVRYTAWLPQTLRNAGYRTIAIAPPLVAGGQMRPEDLRFDEVVVGQFDAGAKNRGTTARQTADVAIEVIEAYEGEAPLAMWVHFMDPHAVHESPVRFPVDGLLDAYDNELSWVDMNLARVFGAVQRRFGNDAVIVVTADHGEEFGEIGNYGHGFTLRESEIRVPLVIVAPGLEPARRAEPVSVLGIAPTLHSLLDLPVDPRLSERSLLLGSERPVVATNPAFLWNEPRMELALVEGRHKLVWSRTTNTVLLYDLVEDPDESDNLAARDPQTATRMKQILQAWTESERAVGGASSP